MATITSLAAGVDMSLFGPDELELHHELLKLEQDIQTASDRIADPTVSTSGPAVTDKQLQELLQRVRGLIRDLELLSEEQDTDAQVDALEACVDLHQAEYQRLAGVIAAAKGQAKRQQQLAAEQMRRELFAGASLPALQREYRTVAEAVQGTSEVTESLQRAKAMLTQQIDQTSATMAVLDTSNNTLGQAKDEFVGQQKLNKTGAKLLNTIQKQEQNDRRILWIGLLVFLVTCTYIGYKRAPGLVKAPVDLALGAAAGAAGQLWQQAEPMLRNQLKRLLPQSASDGPAVFVPGAAPTRRPPKPDISPRLEPDVMPPSQPPPAPAPTRQPPVDPPPEERGEQPQAQRPKPGPRTPQAPDTDPRGTRPPGGFKLDREQRQRQRPPSSDSYRRRESFESSGAADGAAVDEGDSAVLLGTQLPYTNLEDAYGLGAAAVVPLEEPGPGQAPEGKPADGSIGPQEPPADGQREAAPEEPAPSAGRADTTMQADEKDGLVEVGAKLQLAEEDLVLSTIIYDEVEADAEARRKADTSSVSPQEADLDLTQQPNTAEHDGQPSDQELLIADQQGEQPEAVSEPEPQAALLGDERSGAEPELQVAAEKESAAVGSAAEPEPEPEAVEEPEPTLDELGENQADAEPGAAPKPTSEPAEPESDLETPAQPEGQPVSQKGKQLEPEVATEPGAEPTVTQDKRPGEVDAASELGAESAEVKEAQPQETQPDVALKLEAGFEKEEGQPISEKDSSVELDIQEAAEPEVEAEVQPEVESAVAGKEQPEVESVAAAEPETMLPEQEGEQPGKAAPEPKPAAVTPEEHQPEAEQEAVAAPTLPSAGQEDAEPDAEQEAGAAPEAPVAEPKDTESEAEQEAAPEPPIAEQETESEAGQDMVAALEAVATESEETEQDAEAEPEQRPQDAIQIAQEVPQQLEWQAAMQGDMQPESVWGSELQHSEVFRPHYEEVVRVGDLSETLMPDSGSSGNTGAAEGEDPHMAALRNYARKNGVTRLPAWLRFLLSADAEFAEMVAAADVDLWDAPPQPLGPEEIAVVALWDPEAATNYAVDDGQAQEAAYQDTGGWYQDAGAFYPEYAQEVGQEGQVYSVHYDELPDVNGMSMTVRSSAESEVPAWDQIQQQPSPVAWEGAVLGEQQSGLGAEPAATGAGGEAQAAVGSDGELADQS